MLNTLEQIKYILQGKQKKIIKCKFLYMEVRSMYTIWKSVEIIHTWNVPNVEVCK